MKLKNLLLIGLFATSCLSVSAQTEKVFNPYWYLQLQGGASETLGEAKFKDLISPAAQIAIGRQFSPLFGMRFAASGWQSKGGWVNPKKTYKYNYLAGNLDFMLNLTNLFFGYNENRFINVQGFLGGALNVGFNNDDANDLYDAGYNLRYNWTGTKLRPVGRGGVEVDLRLSKCVDLALEGNTNILTDKYNSKKAGNPDWYFNGLIGLRIKLGKKAAPVAAPVVAAPVETQAEPVKEETKPVEEKVVEPAPEPAKPYSCNIFFKINSSKITGAEVAKMEALSAYLKDHSDAKVNVTGYADVQTGNARINRVLSKLRANQVAKELTKKYGIDASRVSVDYKGDTVQPFAENDLNRVSICVTDK